MRHQLLLASALTFLTAALPAQTRIPGFNVTLDPDGRSRAWSAGIWQGKPAVFVWGRAGSFLDFHAPATLPRTAIAVELDLVAWGAADSRSCAPNSTAGFLSMNYCTKTTTSFCVGVGDFLVSDVMPSNGVMWPAAIPTTAATRFHWHEPLSPYAPVDSPIRYLMSYCSPKGCHSRCSNVGSYILPSEPQLMVAVFRVQ